MPNYNVLKCTVTNVACDLINLVEEKKSLNLPFFLKKKGFSIAAPVITIVVLFWEHDLTLVPGPEAAYRS